jgi:signal transduction histidine kinase
MPDTACKPEAKAGDILARIASSPYLPTPPAIALKALEVANRPTCTLRELGAIVALDPGLCGRLLKLVNSSLFAAPRAITSIDRALNLLGLNRLRSLVLGFSLPSLRFRMATGTRVKECWKESVARAVVARDLATRLGWSDPDTEMIAGLLCDLGVLLLQETFAEQYQRVLSQPPEIFSRNQCQLEVATIGVDHAEVSAYILGQWGLPAEITDAIRHHHTRPKTLGTGVDRATLLYFATRIAQLQSNLTGNTMLEEIATLAHEQFRMDSTEFVNFLDSLHRRVGEFAALIEIEVGPYDNFRVLYENAVENLTKFAVEMSLDLLHAQEEKSHVEEGLARAQAALVAKDEQLSRAQKMEAVGQLAGGVAHDFNNLLTVIMGYCELLLAGAVPPATRTSLEQIKKAGERASVLTRQLLALSRKQVVVPEVLDLNGSVSGVVQMFRRIIGKDIEIVTQLSPDLPLIKADPGQVDQVITNLAINARDAMPRGGRLTIETAPVNIDGGGVGNLPAGAYVLLTIRDTGTGMDRTIMEHIFEPFFTTKPRGRGTGLGLATVQGIVKQSGGHIDVESTVGEGTTFRVYLPCARDAAPTPKVKRSDDVLRGTETILVAEDDEDIRVIARRTLELYGYTVLEARTGPEAVTVIGQHAGSIDVLLTDLLLPGLSGYDLALHLAKERPRVKVVFMSGLSDDMMPTTGGLPPGTQFLQKPFTPKGLAAKVREVLG